MEATFKNKKIAILGAGLEGKSAEKFLTAQGAIVTMLDEKDDVQAFHNLDAYDLLVRSPGVKLTHKALETARAHGVPITSGTKIFFDLCPAKIIGVTGTKGKGTTSSLIYEMLKAADKEVYLGGNIGIPPLDFLDKLTPESWVVLELSSFQLQDLHKSPHIAVLLMIVPEHMDYHVDMQEYVDAKRNILNFQNPTDYAVINRDYIPSNESDIYTDGHVFFVSRERSSVDQGAYVKDDALWLLKGDKERKVIDTKDIALPGKHNFENVGAAVVAASLTGVSIETIKHVISTFKGLPHRLEFVTQVHGVRYYDDSFSTTPETAIAAIQAFEAPEILILGGSSKNSDFSELGQVIRDAKNIRAIIGIGDEWDRIKEQLAGVEGRILLIEGADSMEKAVIAASKLAQKGDVVLLSPACASFGMFKNYKDRGEQFKTAVSRL
jgi:UDP-N-acetylmuramoylalanine--D-glutamate ligase